MDTALRLANVLLPLLYLLATVAYGVLFLSGQPWSLRWAPVILRLTLAFDAAYLTLLTIRWHQVPLANVSQVLSALAFAVALVYVIVEWRGRSPTTGFWLVAMAFWCALLSALFHTGAPPNLELFHDPMFAIHAITGLVGYVGFLTAACYGFLYVRLYHELKQGRFSLFFGKLPPLEVLEGLMNSALLVGFVALTGAVVSGWIWAHRALQEDWLRDPKILVTLATWVFYAIVLIMRRLRSWHSRQTAWASLAGLAAVLFSLIAVNRFFTNVHGFF